MRTWHLVWIWYHERQARKWKREWHWHQIRMWEHDYALNPRTDADMRREIGGFDEDDAADAEILPEVQRVYDAAPEREP